MVVEGGFEVAFHGEYREIVPRADRHDPGLRGMPGCDLALLSTWGARGFELLADSNFKHERTCVR
jgi:hypothetical protein